MKFENLAAKAVQEAARLRIKNNIGPIDAVCPFDIASELNISTRFQSIASRILQHGEATGHYHQATGKGVAVMEQDDAVWLLAPNGAIVTHQEHNPVELPASKTGYDRLIVREYDHFAEEASEVVD